MQLVDLSALIPDAVIDLRYASAKNSLGRPLNGALTIAQLDKPAAEHLAQAAELFRAQGLHLVIWDAYRPMKVQEQLKVAHADRHYVLDESNHSRGLAVDLTLTTKHGSLLDMGTDHDNFSKLAQPIAPDLTPEQQSNRMLLIDTMQRVGFTVWPYEWWHFDYVA